MTSEWYECWCELDKGKMTPLLAALTPSSPNECFCPCHIEHIDVDHRGQAEGLAQFYK